jgi:hypothetical protein
MGRGRKSAEALAEEARINANIEAIKKKYYTETYKKYTKYNEKTIQKISEDVLKRGREWFHKYATELDMFLYDSDEIYQYSEPEQDAYGDLMIEFKDWETLYAEEERRRRYIKKGYVPENNL